MWLRSAFGNDPVAAVLSLAIVDLPDEMRWNMARVADVLIDETIPMSEAVAESKPSFAKVVLSADPDVEKFNTLLELVLAPIVTDGSIVAAA